MASSRKSETASPRTDEIVPWDECSQGRLPRQREVVRELGYCPYCENLDIEAIDEMYDDEAARESRGWPKPSLKDLMRSSTSGCQSCTLLFKVIDDFNLPEEAEAVLAGRKASCVILSGQGRCKRAEHHRSQRNRERDYQQYGGLLKVLLQLIDCDGCPLGPSVLCLSVQHRDSC